MKVLVFLLSVELFSLCHAGGMTDPAWASDNNGQGYGNNGAASNGYGPATNGATNGYGDNGAQNGYGNGNNGNGNGYGNNGNSNGNGYGNGVSNGYGDNGNRASNGYGNNGNRASNGYGANNGVMNGHAGGNGYSAPAEPCSHPGKLRGATGSLVYEECVPAGPGYYVWVARRCAPGTAFDPWEGNCSAIDPNFNAEAWRYD